MSEAFGPALPCPLCHARLESICWNGPEAGRCSRCFTDFEFRGFPALRATRVASPAQAAVADAESVCFFHPENRAEKVCDGCGRFLCPVCVVSEGDRTLCPSCVAQAAKGPAIEGVRERVLYDNLALIIAVGILLFFPFWVIAIVTAPVALGFVVHGWTKPGSVTRNRHLRLALAAVLALGELCGWFMLFVELPRRRLHAPPPRTRIEYREPPPAPPSSL